jgi:hypothetical protein
MPLDHPGTLPSMSKAVGLDGLTNLLEEAG